MFDPQAEREYANLLTKLRVLRGYYDPLEAILPPFRLESLLKCLMRPDFAIFFSENAYIVNPTIGSPRSSEI